MRTVTTASLLTLGVSLSCIVGCKTARAGGFYDMVCASQQGSDQWTLALSTTGDGKVQLWREDRQRVRVGSYAQQGDAVTARLEDMTLRLGVSWDNASWSAEDARGTFVCRYVGDERLARWQDAQPFVPPPAPPAVASAPLDLTPHRQPPAPHEQICDFEHNCYGSDGFTSEPSPQVYHMDPAHPDRVTPPPAPQYPQHFLPLRIESNRAAYATITLGSQSVEMLIDSGSTCIFLPNTVAQRLLSNREAELGPDGTTTLADGSVRPARHIVIHRVVIAGHVLTDVQAAVGDDQSSLLLGFNVLSQVTGRFTVDASNSRLLFD
jgi:clan AA aspartic protease (TIGR02281 family)